MAEIPIQPQHAPALARMQHVLEWLSTERVRLEAEMQHVLASGERVQAELLALLSQHYGVDASRQHVVVDAERGVIETPDEPPEAGAPVPLRPVGSPMQPGEMAEPAAE